MPRTKPLIVDIPAGELYLRSSVQENVSAEEKPIDAKQPGMEKFTGAFFTPVVPKTKHVSEQDVVELINKIKEGQLLTAEDRELLQDVNGAFTVFSRCFAEGLNSQILLETILFQYDTIDLFNDYRQIIGLLKVMANRAGFNVVSFCQKVLFERGKIKLFVNECSIGELMKLINDWPKVNAKEILQKILFDHNKILKLKDHPAYIIHVIRQFPEKVQEILFAPYGKVECFTDERFVMALCVEIDNIVQDDSKRVLYDRILFEHSRIECITDVDCLHSILKLLPQHAESILFEYNLINYVTNPEFIIKLIQCKPFRAREILFERDRLQLFYTARLQSRYSADETKSLQEQLLAVIRSTDIPADLVRQIISFSESKSFRDAMVFLKNNLDCVDEFIRQRPDLISNGAALVKFSKLDGFAFRANFVLYKLKKVLLIEDETQLGEICSRMRPKTSHTNERKDLRDSWETIQQKIMQCVREVTNRDENCDVSTKSDLCRFSL